MTTPILDIRELTLARGGKPVLHDVSLQVAPGEIVMIMGPSGSGKSSLLRCLNRLEEPEQGTIRLHGQDVRALPVIALRTRIGLIFQKTAPFPGTVTANVRYGPALRGQALGEDRVRELLEAAALPVELADHPANQLSGGQEQRLAIARALANEPEVLLLDEPTSALDPIATRAVEETLRGLRERLGLTLVWVSHSAEQARRVGDRLCLLEGGRLTREGPTSTLLDPADGDPHVLAFAAGLNSET